MKKSCEHCGDTESRVVFFRGTNYLCNRHRIQLSRHGKFLLTGREKNKILTRKSYSELQILSESGALLRSLKIDTADESVVRDHTWFLYCDYVARKASGEKNSIFLHHTLIGRKTGMDHINGDKNDNRKKNLRHVSPTENNLNRYKAGVTFDKRTKSWVAKIEKNGMKYWLGRHKTHEGAVRARATAEIKITGRNSYGTLNALKEYE